MDGASKFVKGDAIAGIVIILVNIIGGLGIGVLQHGIGRRRRRCSTYARLTVGDGLVSQLPALLISTATGIIVTRAARHQNLGLRCSRQLSAQSRPLYGGGQHAGGLRDDAGPAEDTVLRDRGGDRGRRRLDGAAASRMANERIAALTPPPVGRSETRSRWGRSRSSR